jgi:hypothetical protein
MSIGIPDDLFKGVKQNNNTEYDRIETCKNLDIFKSVFKHAKNKGYLVIIKNDTSKVQHGFVVHIPLFSSVDKIWYKIDSTLLYRHLNFGFAI